MSTIKQPLVSIGIPVYTDEKLYLKCLNCVKNQTYQNRHFIIVKNIFTD